MTEQNKKDKPVNLTRSVFGAFILMALIIGGSVGWAIARNMENVQARVTTQNYPIRENGYKFIHPLIISGDNSGQNEALKPIKNKIYEGTYELLNNAKTKTVSLYLRDLNSGRWAGIQENAIYDSASLLKVPILIAYLKKSESDHTLFSKKILYRGEAQDKKNIEFYTLNPGTEYTVKELIEDMIVKSDNSAKDLLFANLDPVFKNKVFQDLGLAIPNPDAQYKISPKIYSLFFRLLYNASYLTRENSEEALRLLSESDYKDGLIAGVPPTIAIAHKFGQYNSSVASDTNEWELHDCGIIYHPDHPYLLCVMTRGENLDDLSKIITTISRITYEEINNIKL